MDGTLNNWNRFIKCFNRYYLTKSEEMTMKNQTYIAATPRAATVSATISKGLQFTTAFLLAVVILYGAGFVQTSAVHNAAHDMRHSQGFPCH
jgi:cobalt transporter subunit CbtB